MNYMSRLCRKCMAIFMVLLYIWSGTKVIVNAKSAENTSGSVANTDLEVQVISEGAAGEKVEVTHSAPRVVDGIYYTLLKVDGKQAYCIQSSKDTPKEAIYEVEEVLKGNDSFLNKVMYYAYGNPGYRADIWIPDCPNDTTRAYLRSHIVMSYVYDSANTLKREIKDDNWLKWWKNYVQETIEKIEEEPDVPVSELRLERTTDAAYFERTMEIQRTKSNKLYGDARNQVNLVLPDGVIMVNETKETEELQNAVISGGDSFYFKTDLNHLNGETTAFTELKGSIQNDWATLVVKTGSDKQNIGYGVWVPSKAASISMEVEWLKEPELRIDKIVKDGERIYRKGDLVGYRLDIFQTIEGAVAESIVIEDELLSNGIRLLYDSIRISDFSGNEVNDAVIVETPHGFEISGGEVFKYLEFSEEAGIVVEYQVLVEADEMKVIKNSATVRSENTPDDEDEEEVPVEPTPEPEPEPEPESEPESEPEPEPEKETAPKTGDNVNLTAFVLLMILSCTIVLKCTRLSL